MERKWKYYEDYKVNEKFVSASRTVTEADIVQFAGLSGDYSELHMSREYAEKETSFGERIAHGLLGLAIAGGLETHTEIGNARAVASLGWTWDFCKSIKIGDTVHLVQKIAKKRETKNSERGILYFHGWLLNQEGEVVQKGEHRLMVKRRTKQST